MQSGTQDALLRAVAAPLDGPAPRSSRRKLCCRCHGTLLALALCLAGFGGYCCWSSIFHAPILSPGPPGPPVAPGTYRGVNVGGWLVLEPWVTPSLFYPFLCEDNVCPPDKPPVIDEHSFCDRLGPTEAARTLEAFRTRWVTRETFARIAAAGLNVVRVPFGFWIFGDTDLCPGVSSIHHLDSAVAWAEELGLRLILDLHGVAPSQNGMDHSGTSSHAPYADSQPAWGRKPFRGRDWLLPENLNLTRAVLRRVAARYANSSAVARIGMVNEPMAMARDWCAADCPVPLQDVADYFDETWRELEALLPARVGPVLDIGLGGSPEAWAAVRLSARLRSGGVFDTHIYQAWTPFGIRLIPQVMHLRMAACDGAAQLRAFHDKLGMPAMVGEWSPAVTDCATWLNGVARTSGADASNVHGWCSRVPCPTRFNNLTKGFTSPGGPDAEGNCPTGLLPEAGAPAGPLSGDAFYQTMAQYMLGAYETSAGWTFWNFDNELGDPRWSFFEAQARGWFPEDLSVATYAPPVAKCDSPDSYLGSFIVALGVTVGAGLLACYAACVLLCMTPRCAQLRRSLGRRCARGCPRCCARCHKEDPAAEFAVSTVLGPG